MKHLFTLLIPFLFSASVSAQMVSYTLQESFTKQQLDSFLNTTGFSLPISPQYGVDVYQVIYKSPYKNIDSLVNVSGIVVMPKNTSCPSALACYAHGTFARWNQVPSYEGPERPIGLFFSGLGGVVTAMPDELGLGDSDTSILIHPYINAFHSGHASVNLMRAARQLCDTLSLQLNGQVMLTGYSQGGYTTMATHKLIQENYSNEFNVVASAPMSGPYDLKVTMVDVMLSSTSYAVPSYLPYLLLGYHSVYPSLRAKYPTPSDVFKHPYDSIIPPMFYSRNFSTGDIDQVCDPIPRNMIKDSVLAEFTADLNHPLRLILAENDLLGWAPQADVKIAYCTGDQQVNYLNGVRADSAWNANGAPSVISQNFGNLDHGPCVEPALTSAALFLLGKVADCTGIKEAPQIAFRIYPNPTTGSLRIVKEEGLHLLTITDLNGRLLLTKNLLFETETVDLNSFPSGIYDVQLSNANGNASHKKLVVE